MKSILAALLALAAFPAHAEQAFVRRVIDGDTISVCTSDCFTVRISNIDTAELPPKAKCDREATMATEAKARLAELVSGRPVELVTEMRTRDRYGRRLARVVANGRDVGEVLIAEGLARPWRGRREPWCE